MKQYVLQILFFACLVFIAFSVFVSSAFAKMPSQARLYEVYYNGFHIADLAFEIKSAGNKYEIIAIGKTQGLVKGFTKYWFNANTVANIIDDKIIPKSAEIIFNLRKNTRNIKLVYDGDGRIITDTNTPPENRSKRPEVPQNLKDMSFDPLTAALVARQRLQKLRNINSLKKGHQFIIPLYDGRRRSDLHFNIHGKKHDKKGREVIHISYENKPVAGYTNNEIKKLPTHNPVVTIYISDDELLLPVYGSGISDLGFVQGELVKTYNDLGLQ